MTISAMGIRAETYLRSELAKRLSLGRLISAGGLQFTRVYAVTAAIEMSDSDDFHNGLAGDGNPTLVGSRLALAKVLASCLSAGACRSILFENLLARASDPQNRANMRRLVAGEEIYLAVEPQATEVEIVDTICAATTYPEVFGAASRLPLDFSAESTIRSGEDVLRQFASQVSMVILGACDGEAYIVGEAAASTA